MNSSLRAGLVISLVIFISSSASINAQSADETDIEVRSGKYLQSIEKSGGKAFGAVAFLASGRDITLKDVSASILKISTRRDTSDFDMAGLLRLMYLYKDAPRLPPDVKEAVTNTIIDFKYWIDEPGIDSMCYWSENHQVLFHSAEYLAGSLFPDRVFPNAGMTGAEHKEKGRRLLEDWFNWRETYGFSEWLSNVYYEEDIYPLLNLADFAPDPEIRKRAGMMLDQLALNMALNTYKGHFTCTHGRTYENNIIKASGDSLAQVIHIWWGLRSLTPEYMRERNSGGVAAATSSYQIPEAIYQIGLSDKTMENYQVHGVSADEAIHRGMDIKDFRTGMFFWGQGMYTQHQVVDTTAAMWKEWDLHENAFFLGLTRPAIWLSKREKLDDLFRNHEVASEGAILADTYTYTYRTSDYILSTALDKRKGRVDSQSFTWVAGFGGDARVLTTYPGALIVPKAPGYWTGNGADPRAAQYRNVSVIIYNAPIMVSIGESMRYLHSHAWFPAKTFDQVQREGKWTFARKGDGYIGLYAHNGVSWNRLRGALPKSELLSPGRKNVWICELGRKADDGSFEDFISRLKSAPVSFRNMKVSYDSPSIGKVSFSWEGPFTVAGQEKPMRKQMRYDNPYVKIPRFSRRIEVEAGEHYLLLDWENMERISR